MFHARNPCPTRNPTTLSTFFSARKVRNIFRNRFNTFGKPSKASALLLQSISIRIPQTLTYKAQRILICPLGDSRHSTHYVAPFMDMMNDAFQIENACSWTFRNLLLSKSNHKPSFICKKCIPNRIIPCIMNRLLFRQRIRFVYLYINMLNPVLASTYAKSGT